MSHKHGGNAYAVAFATTSLTTVAHNMFPFVAGSGTCVVIEEICIGIASSAPVSVGVHIQRGSTTPLSTAAYVTPQLLGGWKASGAAATSYVNSPSSSLPSTTSASILDARTFEDGFVYEYRSHGELTLIPSQRLDVICQGLSVTTVYGTLKFREVGRPPF